MWYRVVFLSAHSGNSYYAAVYCVVKEDEHEAKNMPLPGRASLHGPETMSVERRLRMVFDFPLALCVQWLRVARSGYPLYEERRG